MSSGPDRLVGKPERSTWTRSRSAVSEAPRRELVTARCCPGAPDTALRLRRTNALLTTDDLWLLKEVRGTALVKLRVLGLRLLEDRNVGVSGFPEREEVLVGNLSLGLVA